MHIMIKNFFLIMLTPVFILLFVECGHAAIDLNITNVFTEEASNIIDILTSSTKSLFALLFTIDIAFFGIGIALKRTPLEDAIEQFIMNLIFAGFILAVINNYQSWTNNFIYGLLKLSQNIYAGQIDFMDPLKMGIKLSETVIDKISGWDPIDSLGFFLAGLILLIVFTLLTAQTIFIKCECMIAMAAAMLLLGFAGLRQTKDYALNVLRYVVSVAFKLFVIQIVLGIGMNFMENFMGIKDPEFGDLFQIIAASLILYVLVKSLPDTISGIINGSHVSSGHQLASAVMSVAAVAGGGAMAAASGGFAGARGAVAASKQAKEEGHTGLGRVGHTAKNLMAAHSQARQQMPGRSAMAKMMDNARANLEGARAAKKVDEIK